MCVIAINTDAVLISGHMICGKIHRNNSDGKLLSCTVLRKYVTLRFCIP